MNTLGETKANTQPRDCGACKVIADCNKEQKAANRREWIFWGVTIVPFAIGAAWWVMKFAFQSGGDAGKDWSKRMLNMKRGNE